MAAPQTIQIASLLFTKKNLDTEKENIKSSISLNCKISFLWFSQ